MSRQVSTFIGSNEFVGCTETINIEGKALFSFTAIHPTLLLNLSIPAPALGTRLEARNNIPGNRADEFMIEAKPDVAEAFWSGNRIFRVEKANDGLHVELDFRVLGLELWTEGGILNIGGSKLSNNKIEHAGTGIAIGA